MSSFRQPQDGSVKIRSFGVTFPSGELALRPAEGWHQLISATRGVMTVRTDECAWVVPPHRAVWIPARVRYRVEMTGIVAMRTIYIRAGLRAMSETCSGV